MNSIVSVTIASNLVNSDSPVDRYRIIIHISILMLHILYLTKVVVSNKNPKMCGY